MESAERFKVSWFSGIAIEMCIAQDKAPHFHAEAEYEKRSAVFSLEGSLLDGSLPSWGLDDVKEWSSMHATELGEAWDQCQRGESPSPIRSLDDDDEIVRDGNRLPELVEVEARDGLGIWVRFDDELSGEVDLSHLAGMGVFKAWDDLGFFRQVSIGEGGEVSWPNEIDIDPYKLYMDLTGKTVEDLFPGWGAGLEADA
jgi:hypothetical protein